MPALLIGPLGKFFGILILVLAIFGAGEWHGRGAVQQAWDASVARQAITAAENVIKQAKHTAKAEVKFIKLKGETEVITKIVEKEILTYAQDPTQDHCLLSPQFERGFNAVSGVLDRPSDRLSTPSGAAGDPLERAGTPLSTVAVLYAHHDAVTQLRDLWDTYHALATWVRETYELQHAASGRGDETE